MSACPRCGGAIPEGRFSVCPRCLLDDGEPPVLIGQGALELGDELGRGGMGVVFKARDHKLGREVAVKFLPAALASRPEFRVRFEREAHALALLNHPNIVTIHDYGEEDGQGYIVMELATGTTLQSLLPLAPQRAIDVVLKIGDALSYAHGHGIIHRDIKPGNILVDSAGNIKVTDFGLARMAGDDARGWTLTTPDQALGTVYYMAPEILAGAPPSPRMDIYSLGVLLYHTMTGALPMGDFERLPGNVDRVVRRAIAQAPEKRYASVDELLSDLRQARAHASEAEGRLPPAEQQWLRAVALVYATASAVAGWALVASVTPQAVNASELHPLALVLPRKLDDGRLVSLARFEVWPTLGALAGFGVALTASGFLRRHWSQTGLDRPNPDPPLAESRWMLALGIASWILYAWRSLGALWGHRLVANYSPFLGAILELSVMYILWAGILEARRRSRPLTSEPKMLIGFGMAMTPPALEILTYALPWLD
ncbi:serine/threonine-protein kinase [Pendulispora albinea]|uniref:Serine/threonine protein kinase n=1 Tax=Pendulispora albinea TaxID=2741071 RepID=A0ABZ2LZ76_9BACT